VIGLSAIGIAYFGLMAARNVRAGP